MTSAKRAASPVWALSTAITLCVLLPAAITQEESAKHSSISALLSFTLVVYVGARLSNMLGRGRAGPLELCFFIFTYVFVALPSLAQQVVGQFPLGGQFDEALRTQGAIAMLLGVLSYDVGRWSRRGVGTRDGVRHQRRIDRRLLNAVGCLAVTSAAVGVVVAGGPGTFFRSRDAIVGAFFGVRADPGQYYKVADQSSAALKLTGVQVPVLVILVALILILRQQRLSRESAPKLLSLCVLAIAVIENAVVNNPVYNARFWGGTVLIALVLAIRPLREARWIRLFAVGLLAGTVLLFPYADVFRHDRATETSRSAVSEQFLSDPDFDLYQEHLRAVQFVQDEGHTLGRQALGSALFWLPRSVWQDKPVATGSMVAEAIGQPGLVASSLWTEAYVDAGLLGVALAFLLLGRGSAALDHAYVAATGTNGRPTLTHLLVTILAGYQFYVLRGSLLPAVGRLVALVLVSIAVTHVGHGAKLRTAVPSTRYGKHRPERWQVLSRSGVSVSTEILNSRRSS